MVAWGTLICMAGAMLIAYGLPLLALGAVGHRVRRFLTSALCGATLGVLAQLLVMQPLLARLAGAGWYERLPLLGTAAAAVLRAVCWAVCLFATAQAARLGGENPLLTVGAGMGMGLGDTLLSVGIVYFNNLFYAVLVNSGSFGDRLSGAGLEATAIEAMRLQLVETPGHLYLLSSFERVVCFAAHLFAGLALAQLLCQGRTLAAVLGAAGVHTVFALSLGLLSYLESRWMAYLVLSIATVAVLFTAWLVLPPFRREQLRESASGPAAAQA